MISILTDTLCVAAPLLPLLHFEATEIRLDTLHEDDGAVMIQFPFTVQAPWIPPETESAGEAEYASLTLDNLWTSCPCTRLHDYPQGVLCVGDSGRISVRFHPAGQSGEILRTISVYCRERPEMSLEELFITAYVLPPRDPFYHYPIRRDPLRLMQEHLSIDPSHSHATLLLANTHPTDSLFVYTVRLPEGITAPTEGNPVRIAPGSAASMAFLLTETTDSVFLPQVRTALLRWRPISQEPEQKCSADYSLPIELLITSR